MEIFAYADETDFPLDRGNEAMRSLGCGILITQKEIPQSIIEAAVNELRQLNDPVLFKKTLKHNHFHAKDDTRIAKEILIKHINSHIDAVFCVAYYDGISEDRAKNVAVKEKLLLQCLDAATIDFFNSTTPVNLILERRPELNDVRCQEWIDNIYKAYDASNLLSFKTYYPRLTVRLGTKKNPGLQVADLLLWSVNRSRSVPEDKVIFNQLKIKAQFFSSADRTDFNKTGTYFINDYPVLSRSNYPFIFKKTETTEDVLHSYIIIERVIRNLESSDFNEENNHLYKEVNRIATFLKLEGYSPTEREFQQIGRAYLRIFDSLPVYKDFSDDNIEAWTILFHTKHTASIMIIMGQIHGNRTRQAIARYRYNRQKDGTLEQIMNPT